MSRIRNFLFQKIRCFDPELGLDLEQDLLVEDGVIKEIDHSIQPKKGVEVIDGKGLTVYPGFIDSHVYLRDPGFEYKETIKTGIQAALNGGVAGMLVMPNTNPACDNRSVVDYLMQNRELLGYQLFVCGAQTKGCLSDELSEMADLYKAGVRALGNGGRCVSNSQLMRHIVAYSAMLDVPLLVHAEDPHLTNNGVMNEGEMSTRLGLVGMPSLSEYLTVKRDIEFSKIYDKPIHFQRISCKESVELIRQSKKEGLKITCEVTPQHLVLTEKCLIGYDTNFKVNPPFRTEEDRLALIEGVKDGTIDIVVSDHSPHLAVEKDIDFQQAPFGCMGLETFVGSVFTHLVASKLIDEARMVQLLNKSPAKLLGLEKFGSLEVGNLANLTIMDVSRRWKVDPSKFRSKSKNNVFIDHSFTGMPIYAVSDGNLTKTDL